MFVDTHCHLTDKKFTDVETVITNALDRGVSKLITVSCSVEDTVNGLNLSEKYSSVYFGAGIHPSDVLDTGEKDVDKLLALASHPKCVCIGEIGLDYYWDKSYIEKQKTELVRQLEIAKQLKLPFSFHSREATEDTVKILKENKDKLIYGGVIHCFSGSVETAKQYLNLGLKIGVGGTVTFKNSRKVQEVVEFLPLDAILTETDSPYLSPEPFRGKVNEPKNIPVISEYIAKIKGEEIEKLSKILYSNAKELFKKL